MRASAYILQNFWPWPTDGPRPSFHCWLHADQRRSRTNRRSGRQYRPTCSATNSSSHFTPFSGHAGTGGHGHGHVAGIDQRVHAPQRRDQANDVVRWTTKSTSSTIHMKTSWTTWSTTLRRSNVPFRPSSRPGVERVADDGTKIAKRIYCSWINIKHHCEKSDEESRSVDVIFAVGGVDVRICNS